MEIAKKEAQIKESESRLEEIQAELLACQTKAKLDLASKDQEIAAKDAQLKESEKQLMEVQKEGQELKNSIASKDVEIATMKSQLEVLGQSSEREDLGSKDAGISSKDKKLQRSEGKLKRSQQTLLNVVLGKWDTDPEAQPINELDTHSFATTWEGTWKGNKATIKAYQPLNILSPAEFLQDAVIMTQLRHPNILQLFAVCMTNVPLIITELVKPENLLDYLRKFNESLTWPQLVDKCQQIANGMAFMQSKNCIHHDLRAKNVFLTDNLTCKVANFFLTDIIRGEEICDVPAGTMYPPKWSPPEVLVANQYSKKSDVWSFGVVLYEIITCGLAPYIGMANSDVIEKVKQGYRMPKPSVCPDNLYQMMLSCWQENPDGRPTFQTLLTQLQSFTAEDSSSEQQGTGVTSSVETLHSFRAVKPGDISFDANEIITDVEQLAPTGWWKGTRKLDGTRGFFPSNYVKII